TCRLLTPSRAASTEWFLTAMCLIQKFLCTIRPTAGQWFESSSFHLVVRYEKVLNLVDSREGMKLRRGVPRLAHGHAAAIADRLAVFRLLGLKNADQACGHNSAEEGGLIHEDQNVDRVAILSAARRNEAEVAGKAHALRQHFAQSPYAAALVELILVAAT